MKRYINKQNTKFGMSEGGEIIRNRLIRSHIRRMKGILRTALLVGLNVLHSPVYSCLQRAEAFINLEFRKPPIPHIYSLKYRR